MNKLLDYKEDFLENIFSMIRIESLRGKTRLHIFNMSLSLKDRKYLKNLGYTITSYFNGIIVSWK